VETAGQEKLGIGNGIIGRSGRRRNASCLARQVGASDAGGARATGIGDAAFTNLTAEMVSAKPRLVSRLLERKQGVLGGVKCGFQFVGCHVERHRTGKCAVPSQVLGSLPPRESQLVHVNCRTGSVASTHREH